MTPTVRVDIPLLPYIKRREEREVLRASRARKHKKVRKIPIRYPSVNRMYPVNAKTGRKYLSDEGAVYKDYISDVLSEAIDLEKLHEWTQYDVTYVFFMTHDMIFTKAGDLREHDVSNFLKATEDALFEWMCESDSTVMGVHGYKRSTVDDPKIVILVSKSSDDDAIRHQDASIDPVLLYLDESLLRCDV